mgnify:CR=1 FL=1
MGRYFAYCTLLDRDEMRRFCPEARATGTGTIDGWRVAFAAHGLGGSGGGCHLVAEPGHIVHGLLYEMDDATLAQLDAISGVGQGMYRQIEVMVATTSGEATDAITYVIPSPTGAFTPSATYVRPILDGARAVGLPAGYVAELEALVAESLVS